MSRIYLKEICLGDFRPYGELKIELPPGPGLTLLVGPNGLGKTALFEAVEWALTGEVLRFSRARPSVPERDLRRVLGRFQRQDQPFESRVELAFAGEPGGRVSRSVRFAEKDSRPAFMTPEVQGARSVLELLQAPGWLKNIDAESLSCYLRATHLLHQSSALHLYSERSEEQWRQISLINELHEVDGLLKLFKGGEITRAFNQHERKLKGTLDDARRQEQDVARLQEQLRLLRQELAAGGALDPKAVDEALSRVMEGHNPASLSPAAPHGPEEPEEKVARALGALDRLEVELTERRAALDASGGAGSGPGAEACSPGQAREDLPAARREWDEQRQRADALRQAQEGHQETIHSLQRLQGLEQLFRREGTPESWAGLLYPWVERYAAAGRADHPLGLPDTERRQRAEGLCSLLRDHPNPKEDLAALAARRGEQMVLRDRLQAQLAARRRTHLQLSRDAELLEQGSSAISAALALLASHIEPGQRDCPLCQHPWEDPGDLKAGAEQVARRADEGLQRKRQEEAAAARQLRRAQADLEEAEELAREMEDEIQKIRSLTDLLKDLDAERDALWEHLVARSPASEAARGDPSAIAASLNSEARVLAQGSEALAGAEERAQAASLRLAALERVLARDELAQRQARLAGRRELLAQVTEGVKRWRRSDRLPYLLQELAAIRGSLGVETDEELAAAAETSVRAAEAAYNRCIGAGPRVQRLGSLLAGASEEFHQQVVAPLEALRRRLSAAISLEGQFDLHFRVPQRAGRTGLETRCFLPGAEDLEGGLPADYVLSEGQRTSAAIVQLLALSLAYPWSRWPCLLLDDPVQYNDMLHVSAFIDLLRNLMQRRGYQVVLSTHDTEVASFFRRKLAAVAGLPCTTVHYLGKGESGVRCRQEGG